MLKIKAADEVVVTETVETGVAAETVAETPVATTAPIADIIDAATKKVAEAAKVKAELKAQKEAEKAAAKAAKEAAKAAKKVAKAEKAATITKNGVTRPRDGSACGKIWAICDAVSRQMQAPAPIAAVMEVAKENVDSNGVLSPLHPTTVRCQFAKWRKFNGVVAVKAEKVAAPIAEAADAVIVDETVIVETAGEEVVA